MDCRLLQDASKFVRSMAVAKKPPAKNLRQVIDLEKDKRNIVEPNPTAGARSGHVCRLIDSVAPHAF
jgi:hypothetical protein